MGTRSVNEPLKLHLFHLPPPLIASMIESLQLEEIVCLVDFIMLSNKKGRHMWHTQIKRMLRCPDMDNRRYSRDDGGSLRWVLKREIIIRNFTIREPREGLTELHHACILDEAWLVRACISFNDDDINKPDDRGITPLHTACIFAHVDVVKLLLDSGAQLSLYREDKANWVPICYAICEKRFDTFKLLLSYHEKEKDKKIGQAFFVATKQQNLEYIKIIMDVCGPDTIHSRSYGRTAFYGLFERGDNIEILEYLLVSGADVNFADDNGVTPIFIAAFYG